MNALSQVRASLGQSSLPLRARWSRIVAAFESPWVAYPLLFVLQLKMIWGVWAYREVTLGDTASYYKYAWQWFLCGEVNIVWSPLYTAFYGCFLFVNPDPVWATFAHRVVIVLAASMLVLAVLRQLLPPSIAWLGAAWWAVLPIVFNTMYEVHLFAVIPVLSVWLLLLTAQGPWRRGSALALLGVSVVLVRNELSVPFWLLGLFLLGYEAREVRRGSRRFSSTLLAYLVAGSLAAALCVGTYSISGVKYPLLTRCLAIKHTLNMAQVYAFGYQQRHPEWDLNPWIQCDPLMREHFGKPNPTLSEMIAANPRAVWEHFSWNVSLLPSGVQLLLFNRGVGSINPDYDPEALRRLHSVVGGVLTASLLALWAIGLSSLWRDRGRWWREWLSSRALGWVGMLSVAMVVPLIVLTQRPRPSYLFSFSVLLIAATGMCLYIALSRWNQMERVRRILPIAMLGLVLFIPGYFRPTQINRQVIARSITRLAAHRAEVMVPGKKIIVPNHPVGDYGLPSIDFPFRAPDDRNGADVAFNETLSEFYWHFNALKSGETFPALCDRLHIDVFYLDEWTILQLASLPDRSGAGAFIDGLEVPGWQLLDHGDGAGDRWRLYRREEAVGK